MYGNPPRYSIRGILTDNNNWELYKLNHSELDKYRIQEVERMLDCCNPKKGFFRGICLNCEKEVILHIRCNGKVCSRCGRSYVDRWVEKAEKKLFKEQHRLVTLTVPADLRPILKDRWDLLKILQDRAYETIQIVASKTLRKKGKKSVKVGMLVGLQTYGQDMKFHPHLHCIVSEKARYKNEFIDLKFIPKDMLRRTWQKVIVKNLCKEKISHKEKIIVQYMLELYPNGFVTDVGERSMNRREVVRYLARYMRHPAIANSRIIFYGRGIVLIRMRDKQKREYSKWFYVDEFIGRMIQHIPPKQFRIVRWYGLYSRRVVRLERKESKRRETISNFIRDGSRVFRCPECKCPLDEVQFVVYKPPDNKISKEKQSYLLGMAS